MTSFDIDEITNMLSPNTNVSVGYSTWYRIPEIDVRNFVKLVTPLYDIKEGRKISKSELDPFARDAWMCAFDMTLDEWEIYHKKIQTQRAWTMAFGNLHQKLIGLFPDWESYPKGHVTGCDNGKKDNSCVAEVKNNINTMNSSSKDSVIRKLKKQHELGKRALLIIINGDTSHCVKDNIEYISGRQFYEEISGRSDFMDSLLTTITDCFKLFKTLTSLKSALENV